MTFLAEVMLNVSNCGALFVHSEDLYVLAHYEKKKICAQSSLSVFAQRIGCANYPGILCKRDKYLLQGEPTALFYTGH